MASRGTPETFDNSSFAGVPISESACVLAELEKVVVQKFYKIHPPLIPPASEGDITRQHN